MASLFGFGGTSTVVNITLNGADTRAKAKLVHSDPNSALACIYAGQVDIVISALYYM